jgi:hypothetical protein
MRVHLTQIGASQRPQRKRVVAFLWRGQNHNPASPGTSNKANSLLSMIEIPIGNQICRASHDKVLCNTFHVTGIDYDNLTTRFDRRGWLPRAPEVLYGFDNAWKGRIEAASQSASGMK